MNKDENKLLQICICKAISLEGKTWIKKDNNKELYENLIKEYEGKITSRYCPACGEYMNKELKRWKDFFAKLNQS